MRAAVITRPGGPEVLEIQTVPRPLPREHEVLVRVHASALNRADLLQRMGRYPAPPGAPVEIPGLEIAGEIADAGTTAASSVTSGPEAAGTATHRGTSAWKIGDRVFGIVGGGGNAEYIAVHESTLARVPDAMSWTEAAAVPEAFITAHDAMRTQAALRDGESVLIHAVGSGVGLAALQLARAFGARCYGTARTAAKIERARDLGLTDGVVVDGDLAVVAEAVDRWTEGRGIDVILDLVGGAYLGASVESAATCGRIVLIGLLGGRSATLNLGTVLTKRVMIRGTVLRTRSLREKAAATEAFAADVVPLLERRAVRPVVDRVLPLERIREAHELLERNATFGKIVLTMT